MFLKFSKIIEDNSKFGQNSRGYLMKEFIRSKVADFQVSVLLKFNLYTFTVHDFLNCYKWLLPTFISSIYIFGLANE